MRMQFARVPPMSMTRSLARSLAASLSSLARSFSMRAKPRGSHINIEGRCGQRARTGQRGGGVLLLSSSLVFWTRGFRGRGRGNLCRGRWSLRLAKNM